MKVDRLKVEKNDYLYFPVQTNSVFARLYIKVVKDQLYPSNLIFWAILTISIHNEGLQWDQAEQHDGQENSRILFQQILKKQKR